MRKILLLAALAAAAFGQSSPNAGNWKTWILPDAKAIAVPPPPDAAATLRELAGLKGFTAADDPRIGEQIKYWDAGPPAYRWVDFITARFLAGQPIGAPNQLRPYTYVSVAIYEATVVAWNAKYTYNRKRPSETDPSLRTRAAVPRSPSYPSEHAAAAGAAAAVLAYFLPAESAALQALAEEAGRSRLYAGVEYVSDYTAGLELGRRVAEQVIARARADGSDAVFNGVIPTGPCMWTGVNPGNVMAAQWKPFLLSSPREFRPPPPPGCQSADVQAQLAAVKSFPRALDSAGFATNAKAFFWQTPEGVTPWPFIYMNRLIHEDKLDAPAAARAYALLATANYDAWIASQDGKFTYWYLRPAQLDTTLIPLFPAPNFPSYPSNHSTVSSVSAAVIAYLFPASADAVRARAKEAGDSRIWAGIHYEMDNQAGVTLGQSVARKFIAWAEADGSQP
ncbi:MAG: phosphatase PAP2 family protein [Bryobacteraceae bacterium]|nr:phosphatase PAP2 family protein [Bryobacteraceae bacterium]